MKKRKCLFWSPHQSSYDKWDLSVFVWREESEHLAIVFYENKPNLNAEHLTACELSLYSFMVSLRHPECFSYVIYNLLDITKPKRPL